MSIEMPYVIEFISSDTHELKKKVSKSLLYFLSALILTLILCYKRRHAQGLKSEMILKAASYRQQQSQDSELLSYFSSFLVASKVLNQKFFAACS